MVPKLQPPDNSRKFSMCPSSASMWDTKHLNSDHMTHWKTPGVVNII
jgi:hypothetical protein